MGTFSDILIIADDREAKQDLRENIKHFNTGFRIIGEADTFLQAIDMYNTLQPELLIIDTNLSDASGFEVLEKLANEDLLVLFISNSPEYAYEAYRYNPVDFLLKPLEHRDVLSALGKARKRLQYYPPKFQKDYPANNIARDFLPRRVAIHSQNEIEYLDLGSIIRMEASGCYTHIFLVNGRKVTVSKSLREYEILLNKLEFTRIHNSHVINMQHVKKMIRKDGLMVCMTDNSIVPIAIRRKELFEEQIRSMAI